jgi:hypothetical protein
MIRWLLLATLTPVSIGFSQSLPSYQLIQEVDGSGMDSVAGMGTDAQENIYIAGTTSSQHFPVKTAVQPNLASAGLGSAVPSRLRSVSRPARSWRLTRRILPPFTRFRTARL